MDLETKRFPIRVSQGISPAALGSENSSDPSFPILAISVIGIIATAFLLVSYYVFVIKCCLNWHRIDLLSSRFSLSRRRRNQDDLLLLSSPAMEARGLDEAAIRSIPIFNFKNRGNDKSRDLGEGSFCECAVCLNEFQEDEKLRLIPQCSHVFHIDCIDVWLQNNANCPLCRTSVSGGSHLPLFDPCRIASPSPSPQEPASYLDSNAIIRNEEDYVVIELGESSSSSTSLPPIQSGPAAISPRKPDPGKQRKKKFIQTSMGDEVIDTRGVDEQFSSILPIRRSFSMDSAADQKLFLAVQGILQQRSEFQDLGLSPNGSCSSRARRTFFSFGHGRASRSAVQPLCLEP